MLTPPLLVELCKLLFERRSFRWGSANSAIKTTAKRCFTHGTGWWNIEASPIAVFTLRNIASNITQENAHVV